LLKYLDFCGFLDAIGFGIDREAGTLISPKPGFQYPAKPLMGIAKGRLWAMITALLMRSAPERSC